MCETLSITHKVKVFGGFLNGIFLSSIGGLREIDVESAKVLCSLGKAVAPG